MGVWGSEEKKERWWLMFGYCKWGTSRQADTWPWDVFTDSHPVALSVCQCCCCLCPRPTFALWTWTRCRWLMRTGRLNLTPHLIHDTWREPEDTSSECCRETSQLKLVLLWVFKAIWCPILQIIKMMHVPEQSSFISPFLFLSSQSITSS